MADLKRYALLKNDVFTNVARGFPLTGLRAPKLPKDEASIA